jgi:DNA-binding HxlR family transcriptional regulator
MVASCRSNDETVGFENRSILRIPKLATPHPVFSDERPTSTPSTLALLELLGRRWALRILWELRLEPATFQALQARCDSMSTSVLSQRLVELREAQLVEKEQTGSYRLTEPGSRLLARLDGMDEWTQEWTRRLGRPTADSS